MMKQPENMCKVRNEVLRNVGKRVKIRSNKGRNKVDIAEGIIAKTYPCVFLVELSNGLTDSVKTMSFSYTDVLSK